MNKPFPLANLLECESHVRTMLRSVADFLQSNYRYDGMQRMYSYGDLIVTAHIEWNNLTQLGRYVITIERQNETPVMIDDFLEQNITPLQVYNRAYRDLTKEINVVLRPNP